MDIALDAKHFAPAAVKVLMRQYEFSNNCYDLLSTLSDRGDDDLLRYVITRVPHDYEGTYDDLRRLRPEWITCANITVYFHWHPEKITNKIHLATPDIWNIAVATCSFSNTLDYLLKQVPLPSEGIKHTRYRMPYEIQGWLNAHGIKSSWGC